jgi:hypothetical protein
LIPCNILPCWRETADRKGLDDIVVDNYYQAVELSNDRSDVSPGRPHGKMDVQTMIDEQVIQVNRKPKAWIFMLPTIHEPSRLHKHSVRQSAAIISHAPKIELPTIDVLISMNGIAEVRAAPSPRFLSNLDKK